MASRSSGLWRSARCRTSTASSPWPVAAWASARVLQRRRKAGIDLERPLDRPDGIVRPAGEVEHEAQHVVEHGAVGRQFERPPGLGDRLVMMAERAQRQRAVAQDLAASRGILAGIDQRHVEDLDRRANGGPGGRARSPACCGRAPATASGPRRPAGCLGRHCPRTRPARARRRQSGLRSIWMEASARRASTWAGERRTVSRKRRAASSRRPCRRATRPRL